LVLGQDLYLNEVLVSLKERKGFEKPFPASFGAGFVFHDVLRDLHRFFQLGQHYVSSRKAYVVGRVHARKGRGDDGEEVLLLVGLVKEVCVHAELDQLGVGLDAQVDGVIPLPLAVAVIAKEGVK